MDQKTFSERVDLLKLPRKLDTNVKIQNFALEARRITYDHWLMTTDEDFTSLIEKNVLKPWAVDPTRWPATKIRRVKIAWIERLSNAVAYAHFCRAITSTSSSGFAIMGPREDALLVELVVMTVQPAIEKLADHSTSSHRWQCIKAEKPFGKQYRSWCLTDSVARLAAIYDKDKKNEMLKPGSLKKIRALDAAIARRMGQKIVHGKPGRPRKEDA